MEIFSFIEKQEDYIEQLEKESKYCRNELTNLLGKVKDVINENEQLTENARSELVGLGSGNSKHPIVTTSPSSDSDEHLMFASGRKTPSTPRKGASKGQVQSPRYASAPNIVYEARISELEAELMQASIDLRRLRTENEELKRKLSHTDPLTTVATLSGGPTVNCIASSWRACSRISKLWRKVFDTCRGFWTRQRLRARVAPRPSDISTT